MLAIFSSFHIHTLVLQMKKKCSNWWWFMVYVLCSMFMSYSNKNKSLIKYLHFITKEQSKCLVLFYWHSNSEKLKIYFSISDKQTKLWMKIIINVNLFNQLQRLVFIEFLDIFSQIKRMAQYLVDILQLKSHNLFNWIMTHNLWV